MLKTDNWQRRLFTLGLCANAQAAMSIHSMQRLAFEAHAYCLQGCTGPGKFLPVPSYPGICSLQSLVCAKHKAGCLTWECKHHADAVLRQHISKPARTAIQQHEHKASDHRGDGEGQVQQGQQEHLARELTTWQFWVQRW